MNFPQSCTNKLKLLKVLKVLKQPRAQKADDDVVDAEVVDEDKNNRLRMV